MATVTINESIYKVNIEFESKGTVSIIATKGEKGDDGGPGPANTLAIGTVASGSTAAASITGTAPNQTLNLTLPKGDKGDTGDTGATGATGPANTLAIGTVASGATPAATITGTAPNQTLNLTLPKGDTGATGSDGDDGVSITSVVQTTTSTADGGTNVITVTLSNGRTSTFNVLNGTKGSTGTSGLGALTLSTTDIGEGVSLADNTLYGVYE